MLCVPYVSRSVCHRRLLRAQQPAILRPALPRTERVTLPWLWQGHRGTISGRQRRQGQSREVPPLVFEMHHLQDHTSGRLFRLERQGLLRARCEAGRQRAESVCQSLTQCGLDGPAGWPSSWPPWRLATWSRSSSAHSQSFVSRPDGAPTTSRPSTISRATNHQAHDDIEWQTRPLRLALQSQLHASSFFSTNATSGGFGSD